MARHFDQCAIERAAVADRHSGDELDAALKAARHAIEYSFSEIWHAGRTLIEAIDAARWIVPTKARRAWTVRTSRPSRRIEPDGGALTATAQR